MIKFNRLKALTEDFNVITTALEKSTAKLMEVRKFNFTLDYFASKNNSLFSAKLPGYDLNFQLYINESMMNILIENVSLGCSF